MANKDSVDETIAETKNDEEVINVSEAEEKNKKDTQDIVEISDDDEEDDDEDEIVVIPKLKRFFAWFWKRKKITLPFLIVLLAGIIFGFPTSRYTVLGTVIKKDFPVIVTDISTGLPVSEATVSLRGKTATTDGEGKAVLQNVPVGYGDMTLSKNYYDQTVQRVAVGLSLPKGNFDIRMKANGRQVPVHAVNKITGKALAGVTIKAGDSTAQTDENGDTVIVLSPDMQKIKAEFTAENYNPLGAEVIISQQVVNENTFKLTPAGKIFFLSKRTGKIDVLKSNIDGSQTEVVVKATGKEDDQDTVLLASTDWKYLALKSHREGDKARLYLIEAESGKLSEIDGDDEATVDVVGWTGHTFVYKVSRENIEQWQPKRNALKSFNADTKQLSIIDETEAKGTKKSNSSYQEFTTAHVLAGKVVYGKTWQVSTRIPQPKDMSPAIFEANPDGSDKRTLKEFEMKNSDYGYYLAYIGSRQSEPGEIHFRYEPAGKSAKYFTYLNGDFAEDKELDDESFWDSYPTFLESPGRQNTFWSEDRDGKATLFVGDTNGESGNIIAEASEHRPYGWFTDNYVLVSKDDSELYIMPSNGLGSDGNLVKITNYHRPVRSFNGYGGGYGGI